LKFLYFSFMSFTSLLRPSISSNRMTSSLFHTFRSLFSISSYFINCPFLIFNYLFSSLRSIIYFLYIWALFSSINLLLRILSNSRPGLSYFLWIWVKDFEGAKKLGIFFLDSSITFIIFIIKFNNLKSIYIMDSAWSYSPQSEAQKMGK